MHNNFNYNFQKCIKSIFAKLDNKGIACSSAKYRFYFCFIALHYRICTVLLQLDKDIQSVLSTQVSSVSLFLQSRNVNTFATFVSTQNHQRVSNSSFLTPCMEHTELSPTFVANNPLTIVQLQDPQKQEGGGSECRSNKKVGQLQKQKFSNCGVLEPYTSDRTLTSCSLGAVNMWRT